MTDDIVTRLRNIANLRGDLGGHVIPLACLNAADEIERLRADYEHCRLQMLIYQRIAELGPQAVRNESD